MENIGHRSSRFGNNKHQPNLIDTVAENPKSLEPPDSHHLLAAEGWLELGNEQEANEEMAHISPQMCAHPEVMEMRWKIYAKAGHWELAAEVARCLSEMLPNDSLGFIHYAFSLHELKRTKEAWGVLIPVVDKFPEFIIRYNLACYCCQLGNFKEAMEWMKKAIELADKDDIQKMALKDPDLKSLWDKISEI